MTTTTELKDVCRALTYGSLRANTIFTIGLTALGNIATVSVDSDDYWASWTNLGLMLAPASWVTVRWAEINRLVRIAPDTPVQAAADRLTVIGPNLTAHVPTASSLDHPDPVTRQLAEPLQQSVAVPDAWLPIALGVKAFTSTDSSMAALGAVWLANGRAQATDSYTMAWAETPSGDLSLDWDRGKPEHPVPLPARLLDRWSKARKATGLPVAYSWTLGEVIRHRWSQGGFTWERAGRGWRYEMPDMGSIIDGQATRDPVTKEMVHEMIGQLAVHRNPDSCPIVQRPGTHGSGDGFGRKAAYGIQCQGEPLPVTQGGWYPEWLLRCLRYVMPTKADTATMMAPTNGLGPARITSTTRDRNCLIMPVRLH